MPGLDTQVDDPERVEQENPIFVIQKHAAKTLHYDFRLEVDGVLKSWAVPKGLSLSPEEKRLAVPTEDYRNLTERRGEKTGVAEGLRQGHISFWLDGTKIRGGYALTRFRTGKNEAWLLVKKNDDEADPGRNPVVSEPRSVISGRTIEEIEAEEGDR